MHKIQRAILHAIVATQQIVGTNRYISDEQIADQLGLDTHLSLDF